jgi:hypothetical protein
MNSISDVEVPEDFQFLQPIVDTNLFRIGNTFDGGYVVSQELFSKTTKLVSIGYGWDSSFEMCAIRSYPKIKCIIYDDVANIKKCVRPWIKFPRFFFGSLAHGKIVSPRQFSWFRPSLDFAKMLFIYARRITYKNAAIVRVPANKNELSVNQILSALGVSEIVYLKIDIEGSEYEIIDQIIESESYLIGMTIEFHDLSVRKTEFISCIKKLQAKFVINHLHPNNHRDVINGFPDVIEISFVSMKLLHGEQLFRCESHLDVDSPNNRLRPDYNLIFTSRNKGAKSYEI